MYLNKFKNAKKKGHQTRSLDKHNKKKNRKNLHIDDNRNVWIGDYILEEMTEAK